MIEKKNYEDSKYIFCLKMNISELCFVFTDYQAFFKGFLNVLSSDLEDNGWRGYLTYQSIVKGRVDLIFIGV